MNSIKRVCVTKRQSSKPVRKAFLVYQGGIANVFAVDAFNLADFGRNARRLIQADFATCIAFANDLGHAGCVVRTAACNMAGDITHFKWSEDLESQPFSDKFTDLSLN